jgi:hypothetical protein
VSPENQHDATAEGQGDGEEDEEAVTILDQRQEFEVHPCKK